MSSSTSASPCRRFTLAEIQSATKDFKLCIGEGGFGKVYFGKITSEGQGLYVAIKRLDSKSNQGESEFRTEIEMLSTLRHCHLVSLIGYCEENKEMILVYEYMRHGTLYHHLHKAKTPLNWVQRMNIAIGAGRGLDYLHTGVGTHDGIIHRDVKTSNILLDKNFAALISDFGLCTIGPTNQSISFVDASVKGTFGYLDPEYFYTGRLTRKTDVFAFGVVLFELLSGRLPVDIRYGEDQCSLVRWAQKCLRGRKLDQMVDSNIKGTIFPKCLRGFAQIAGNCLHSVPKERPTMTEVVASLQALLQLQINSASSSGLTGFTWKIHKYPVSETKQISDQCDTSSPKSLENNVEMPDHLWEIVAGDLINFTYGEMELATRDFGDHTWLGNDSYGVLFKGWVDKMTYSPCKDDTGLPVVVKKLYRYKHFDQEMLKKHGHPNFDKLIGYCLESEKLLLVYKFMHNGNFDYLLGSDQFTSSPKGLENNVEMSDHCWEIVAGDLINFTYGEMKLATRDFGDHTYLGKDSYGKLYKGWVDIMTYSPCKDDTGLPVVVKKLYRNKHFEQEKLKKHRHPILDKLIGYCLESGKFLLVYKFMHNGNFDDLLHSDQYTSSPKSLEKNVEMSDHCWEVVAGDLINFTYGEMELATRDFGDHVCLGKDSYGKLYKGWVDKMTYSPCKNDTGLPVVVNKLYRFKHFDLEMLNKYRHPNLVKLIGYCLEGGKLLLVYEFMHNGNFDELLRSGAVARLPLATKVKIAVGIARGIAFLNSIGYVSNSELYRHKILLDEDFTAKLSDYDVTKLVNGHYTCACPYIERHLVYYYPGREPLLLQTNLFGFQVVFAEILTGKRISLRESFWSEYEKNSYYNLAKVCFRSCNEMDSKSRMLTMLKDNDNFIQNI